MKNVPKQQQQQQNRSNLCELRHNSDSVEEEKGELVISVFWRELMQVSRSLCNCILTGRVNLETRKGDPVDLARTRTRPMIPRKLSKWKCVLFSLAALDAACVNFLIPLHFQDFYTYIYIHTYTLCLHRNSPFFGACVQKLEIPRAHFVCNPFEFH